METARIGWQRRLIPLMLLLVLTLAGCNLIPSSPTVIRQENGLPTLRLLDWGFYGFYRPVWSPDGRWIAVMAGLTETTSRLVVISPDGQTKYELSDWGCGDGLDPEYAWLPDGRLSCINAEKPYSQLCIGGPPFSTCTATHLDQNINGSRLGLAWTLDGQSALFTAWPNDKSASFDTFYVLAPDGSVRQVLTFPGYYGAVAPAFRPHVNELAYSRGASADLNLGIIYYDLVISPFTEDASGKITLGPARTLTSDQYPESSSYTWSPSGRWLAVRINDYHGNDDTRDRIALINADDPGQIIDVVQTYRLFNQAMMNPILSPDGKTLIVFGDIGPQPYSIDIASFLASKGLQP